MTFSSQIFDPKTDNTFLQAQRLMFRPRETIFKAFLADDKNTTHEDLFFDQGRHGNLEANINSRKKQLEALESKAQPLTAKEHYLFYFLSTEEGSPLTELIHLVESAKEYSEALFLLSQAVTEQADLLFAQALERNSTHALFHKGLELIMRENDEAKKYLTRAYDGGSALAAYELGHLFKVYSEQYFAYAASRGHPLAILCLGQSYEAQKEIGKAAAYYRLASYRFSQEFFNPNNLPFRNPADCLLQLINRHPKCIPLQFHGFMHYLCHAEKFNPSAAKPYLKMFEELIDPVNHKIVSEMFNLETPEMQTKLFQFIKRKAVDSKHDTPDTKADAKFSYTLPKDSPVKTKSFSGMQLVSTLTSLEKSKVMEKLKRLTNEDWVFIDKENIFTHKTASVALLKDIVNLRKSQKGFVIDKINLQTFMQLKTPEKQNENALTKS